SKTCKLHFICCNKIIRRLPSECLKITACVKLPCLRFRINDFSISGIYDKPTASVDLHAVSTGEFQVNVGVRATAAAWFANEIGFQSAQIASVFDIDIVPDI